MDHAADSFTLDCTRRYHFVAIGGIGMSALAQILLARGCRVSGSDQRDSALLAKLRGLGAEVAVGHAAAHVQPGDVVILSDAIRPENPEWVRARELDLTILKRADLLGVLANGARGVAVSGTHGKTTTSGMLALICVEAGLDPTCVLGGELAPLGGNARAGGELTLVEACEAFNSFLDLTPDAAIVTNLEPDHLDFHGTEANLYASFRQFLGQVRGLAVVNGDDVRLRAMDGLAPRTLWFGAGANNDYRYTELALGAEPTFTLTRHGAALGQVTLRVPGEHNVSNATGAAALALELGADFGAVQRALAAFPGMHRRFERIGQFQEAAVIDDYGHHPTELRATLAAARAVFPGRLIVIFQPHLFSRTRDFLDDFAVALAAADEVLLAPIYPAREEPIAGVDHHLLAGRIAAQPDAPPVHALGAPDDAVAHLRGAVGAGDAILTVGAGDIDAVAYRLAADGGAQ